MRSGARRLIELSLLCVSACGGAAGSAPADTSSAAGGGGTSISNNNAGAGGSVGLQPPATWPTGAGACTQKPGTLRGKSVQTLTAAGLSRSFIYYAPASLDPNVPAPVVIIPHGFTMNAQQMFDITGYAELAEREGIIALFPDGQAGGLLAGPWNVGSPDCSSSLGVLPLAQGDDQSFVNAMLRFAEADQCLDTEHVYMTGFSMGGYFANETACLRPEVRAIAPHSGGSHDLSACNSQRKPVLLMHFQEDGLIPFRCGQQARDRWLLKNGCSADAPDIKPVQGGSCEYYKGCPEGGQVTMCSFNVPMPSMSNEMYIGHGWSGGSKLGTGAGFAIPGTESATELSWSFFKQYAW
jgi:polyhydroxybutyrate depolymerase